MKIRFKALLRGASFISVGLLTARAGAAVVQINFNAGADSLFTQSDGTIQAITTNPGTFGTLGYFNQGLLCFGNAHGDFSGNPTSYGIFNVNPAGFYSAAMTIPLGTTVSEALGTTGWGIISGGPGNPGLSSGNHFIGFETSTGNFGFMNITLVDDGTGSISADSIKINYAFVESSAGQSITVSAIPEPSLVSLLGLGSLGFAIRRRGRKAIGQAVLPNE